MYYAHVVIVPTGLTIFPGWGIFGEGRLLWVTSYVHFAAPVTATPSSSVSTAGLYMEPQHGVLALGEYPSHLSIPCSVGLPLLEHLYL